MPILPYLDHQPQLADDVFVAPDANVVGRVRMGQGSSIWFGAVVRGDTDEVEIAKGVNVQDGCVVHTQAPDSVRNGARTSLGHRATVHGADIGEDCLIGIGASVLSGARVGAGSIVAAHALVPEGMRVPPGSLVMGVPGRVVRPVTVSERERIHRTATLYSRLAIEYSQVDGMSPPGQAAAVTGKALDTGTEKETGMSDETRNLMHVRAAELSPDTAQTTGMQRTAAISRALVGSSNMWMGITEVAPGISSGAHHHGHSETAIYVISGSPTFGFRSDGELVEIAAEPGDFVYVPPFVPHVETNNGDEVARVLIARSTDEAIVENLPEL